MSNILTTKELAIYRQAIIDQFNTNPNGDGSAMQIVIDAVDDAQKLERYTQVVNNLKTTRNLSGVQGGDLDVAVTVSTAGTGYVAGTQYPVDGGAGGSMVILTVGGAGEILTAECNNLGKGYGTPTVDLTGDGDGLGVVALTAQPVTGLNQVNVLDDMLALV